MIRLWDFHALGSVQRGVFGKVWFFMKHWYLVEYHSTSNHVLYWSPSEQSYDSIHLNGKIKGMSRSRNFSGSCWSTRVYLYMLCVLERMWFGYKWLKVTALFPLTYKSVDHNKSFVVSSGLGPLWVWILAHATFCLSFPHLSLASGRVSHSVPSLFIQTASSVPHTLFSIHLEGNVAACLSSHQDSI